ncbi:hypothetical protein [Geminicoccus flavidas]|uniref:hypothetical protein n=1 Tax=Geminicoccus flavidas TaxID=2506407 RepID=UPI00135937E4|nr:hypothetical protein [Geminicoccus flavidas]
MTLAIRPAFLLVIALGYTLWGGALVVLYGVLSLGCVFGWEEVMLGPLTLQRGLLLLLWLLSVLVIALLSWQTCAWLQAARAGRPTPLARFTLWLAAACSIAAAGATLFMGLPILGASACI